MVVWTRPFPAAFFATAGGRRDTAGRLSRLRHFWNISGDGRGAEMSGNPRLRWTQRKYCENQSKTLNERLVISHHLDRPQNPRSPPRRTPLHYLPASYAGSQARHWSQYPPVEGRIQRLCDLNKDLDEYLEIWILKTKQLTREIRHTQTLIIILELINIWMPQMYISVHRMKYADRQRSFRGTEAKKHV